LVCLFELKRDWVFLERLKIFSRFQFTGHCIEFVLVEANQLAVSNPNVVLTRQTYGQRSSRATGSKRRALAFYFAIRICYKFLISKNVEDGPIWVCAQLRDLQNNVAARWRLLTNFATKCDSSSDVATVQRLCFCKSQSCACLDQTFLYILMDRNI